MDILHSSIVAFLLPIVAAIFLVVNSRKIYRWTLLCFSLIQLPLLLIALTAPNGHYREVEIFGMRSVFPSNFAFHMQLTAFSKIFLALTCIVYFFYTAYLYLSRKQTSTLELGALFFLYIVLSLLFTASNLFLIYALFEFAILPSVILLSINSNGILKSFEEMRTYLTYNIVAGGFLLFAILQLNNHNPGLVSNIYSINPLGDTKQHYLVVTLVAFLLAAAIKSPFFPLYRWILPVARASKARNLGVLSALIDKSAFFPLYILVVNLQRNLNLGTLKHVITAVGVIGLYYFLTIAYRASKLRDTLLFISFAHYSVMLIGLSYLNYYGFYGTLFYVFSHGVITIALFLLLDLLEEEDTRVVATKNQYLLTVFLLLCFANASLPGSSGFVGEFLILISSFEAYLVPIAVLVMLSSLFTMWILLRRYKLLLFNEETLEESKVSKNPGLSFLFLLSILTVIFFGFYPHPVLTEAESFLNMYM
jgi:NADH-quinone oxidoreductase subunit M